MSDAQMFGSEKLLKHLLGTQYFAVLCTAEMRQPYSNLIAFAASEDVKSLVFVTNRNTRKYRNIIENNNISILIDSRTNQSNDISTAIAVTAVGTAHEETDRNSSLYSVFLEKHPQLKKFTGDPDTAMVVLNVYQYIIASFDKTREITIN